MIEQGGKLVPSKLVNWWGKSQVAGSNRSGIGETRTDRRKLQAALADYERKHNPAVVQAVEAVIGHRANGDIFQGLTDYLNNFSTPTSLGPKADQLTEAFVKFLAQVRADAQAIKATLPSGAAALVAPGHASAKPCKPSTGAYPTHP